MLLADLLLSLFVGACTTPERTLTISTWDTSHTTQTLVMAHEVGLQRGLGDRALAVQRHPGDGGGGHGAGRGRVDDGRARAGPLGRPAAAGGAGPALAGSGADRVPGTRRPRLFHLAACGGAGLAGRRT